MGRDEVSWGRDVLSGDVTMLKRDTGTRRDASPSRGAAEQRPSRAIVRARAPAGFLTIIHTRAPERVVIHLFDRQRLGRSFWL